MKIKITSDSTCDLAQDVLEMYDIDLVPLIVIKGDREYLDGITITPDDIFSHVAAGGNLCTTAARNAAVYHDMFARYAEDYDGIIHINIGANFSSSYQNACMAAMDFDNVRVIDSMNLSTGQGHIVLKAVELSQTATSLDELKAELDAYAQRVESSFVLDRLDYMVKGGRCSAAAALGANLLNLKPCIEVKDGKMSVVKKYRGHFDKCLFSYIKDRLENRNDLDYSRIFLTYTVLPESIISEVRGEINTLGSFETMYECQAGCTISCHCGPGTLGILLVRK